MIWVGTSGYNYTEWRDSFYPHGFPTAKMLPYYSERFRTVEINYSFYHMPTENTLANWVKETPDGFTFTLKAPQSITHRNRLRDCETLIELLLSRSKILGPKLGLLLFQRPPKFKKDIDRFRAFLDLLPAGTRAAWEFRDPSWLADDVFDTLREHQLTLCITDTDETTTPMVATANYGYFRLRDEGYTPSGIQEWAAKIQPLAEQWTDTFVYFKHEAEGKGPEFARIFLDALAEKQT